jgi:hypothetical protein
MLVANKEVLADARPVANALGPGPIDDGSSFWIVMIEESLARHLAGVVSRKISETIIPREASQMGTRSFSIYQIEDLDLASRLRDRRQAKTRSRDCDKDKRRKKLSFHHVLRILEFQGIGERN